HRERLALAVRAKARHKLIEDGRRLHLPFERHCEHARRFVHDDQRVVFEDDAQIAGLRGHATPRAPRPIHPHTDAIAGRQLHGGRTGSHFNRVDEYLASIERDRCSTARAEALALGEKLIKPHTLFSGRDDPFHLIKFLSGCSFSDASLRRSFWPSRFHICSRQFTVFLPRSSSRARRCGTRTRTRARRGTARISTRTAARGAVLQTAVSSMKTSCGRIINADMRWPASPITIGSPRSTASRRRRCMNTATTSRKI